MGAPVQGQGHGRARKHIETLAAQHLPDARLCLERALLRLPQLMLKLAPDLVRPQEPLVSCNSSMRDSQYGPVPRSTIPSRFKSSPNPAAFNVRDFV